jgi:hypothetical protein
VLTRIKYVFGSINQQGNRMKIRIDEEKAEMLKEIVKAMFFLYASFDETT